MSDFVDLVEKGALKPPESWKAFSEVPLIQFLKYDPRPIFVIDLSLEDASSKGPLDPIFINPTLYQANSLYDAIRGIASRRDSDAELSYQIFAEWARDSRRENASSELQFGDICWSSTLLDGRWNVLVARSFKVSGHGTTSISTALPQTDASLPKRISPQIHDDATSNLDTPPTSSSPGSRILPTNLQNFFATDPARSDNGGSLKEEPVTSMSDVDGDSSTRFTNATGDTIRHDLHIAKRNADLLAKISAFATVAIYIVDLEGEILFCNDSWYEMTGHPRDQTNAMTWMNAFEDNEIPRIMDVWRRVAVDQEPVQFQARLKRRWKPSPSFASASKQFPTWISAWTYPDVSPDGKTVGCCGVMTDISEQKWSEQLMQQKLSDAVERASLSEQLSVSARQAADSERRFRSLSDEMPVGIWLSDESGSVIYGNDAYYELVPGARVNKKLDWDAVPEEDTARVKEAYRQLLEDHVKCSFELRLTTPGVLTDEGQQQTRWVSVSVYPELHPDGQLKYLVGCLIDISSLKWAEHIQEVRASDALESKRQLEGFIDMTSHEMRNPLGAIVHSAEDILLSFQSLDVQEISKTTIANAIEAAQTIIYCAEHSTRIVSDILLVSKLEAGLLDITPSVVQPIHAIEQALRMFRGEMRSADISHSLKVDDSFSLLQVDYVHLDMNRVLQIFVNLITNAIKFTRPEPVRRIDVGMKVTMEKPSSFTDTQGITYLAPQFESSKYVPNNPVSKDRIVYINVQVADTGCGLTEAEQKNLFQRFAQAGKRTHVKYGGTGLGLFISRQLCEMQGGQIGLRSEPTKGSTFSFFVKAKKALPYEIHADSDHPEDSSLPNRRLSARSLIPPLASSATTSDHLSDRRNSRESTDSLSQQHTILLVEDNLINQKVVAKKLTTQNYAVTVANHGVEALDHIQASSLHIKQPASAPAISLILLDLEMPVMDGLTCIQQIRYMERSGELRYHVPVIAVTANARQEQVDQAKAAGMDEVITKPFRIQQLIPVITRLVNEFPISKAVNP